MRKWEMEFAQMEVMEALGLRTFSDMTGRTSELAPNFVICFSGVPAILKAPIICKGTLVVIYIMMELEHQEARLP